jgi:hypothetical protein
MLRGHLKENLLQPNTGSPSVLKSGLILLGLAFACIATLLFAADSVCHANIEQWTPYYPGAEVVSIEYDFIRARAIGTTTVVLTVEEDAETVRQFYRDTTINLMRAEQTRGLAATSWDVQSNGTDSVITLYSECAR